MACEDPDRVVYSIVTWNDTFKGLRDISSHDFANAINRTAWWLVSELGKGSLFPTIGYIGPRMLSRRKLMFLSHTTLMLNQTTIFDTYCSCLLALRPDIR